MVGDDVKSGKVLHVIDIQSGDIIQGVHVDLKGAVSAILVDGDEVYIAGIWLASMLTMSQCSSWRGPRREGRVYTCVGCGCGALEVAGCVVGAASHVCAVSATISHLGVKCQASRHVCCSLRQQSHMCMCMCNMCMCMCM